MNRFWEERILSPLSLRYSSCFRQSTHYAIIDLNGDARSIHMMARGGEEKSVLKCFCCCCYSNSYYSDRGHLDGQIVFQNSRTVTDVLCMYMYVYKLNGICIN